MKNNNIGLLSLAFAFVLFTSCELDNYKAPDATISGSIYDVETNELVRQDIVSGAQIEYIEQGFTNPQTQYQVIKNDGTYRNNLMFSGTYTMRLRRGNFVPVDEFEVKIKEGDNVIDYQVLPYIRIKNIKIEKGDGVVTAEFNIQQTVPNKVAKIGIYAHQQATVGATSKTAFFEKTVGAVTTEDTVHKLTLAIDDNFTQGKQYYFIVGALIDAAEAKPNYAAPVRIAI
jgi:hypothetical protein